MTDKQQPQEQPKPIFDGKTAMGAVRKTKTERVKKPFKANNEDEL